VFLLKIILLPELKCDAGDFDWVVKFVSIGLLGCTIVSSGYKEFKLELTARMHQISWLEGTVADNL
jgi:hypothetical protein